MAIKETIKKNPFIRALCYPVIAMRQKQAQLVKSRIEEYYDSFISSVTSGSLTIKMDDFGGHFEMGIHTSLVRRFFFYKEFEQVLAERVREYLDPDKDVIDAGANIGFYTVLFAKNIHPHRRVLAAEPTPNALEWLKTNIQRNGTEDQVIVYKGVLVGEAGTFQLNVIPGMEEYSTMGEMVHNSVKDSQHETLTVQGNTVDSLVDHYGLEPGFIKMDTEGAENSVLGGAGETIRAYKPVILSELSDTLLKKQGSSSREVLDRLQGYGYTIFDAYTLKTVVSGTFEGEILAVPEGRNADYMQNGKKD